MSSKEEFDNAVSSCGYAVPNRDVFQYFHRATRNYPRKELAMLLAQLIHESGGFQFREEQGNHYKYVDDVGLPGKSYHGRGFIQLTWGGNYKAASHALGLGDKLLHHPELVSEDTDMSMRVSIWYWEDRVRPALRGRENQFGVTTNAINGPIECGRGYNERAARRYQLYLKVANAMNIQDKAVENGCYN